MSESARAREGVILLHGLGRSALAMWPLARRLRRAGYVVVNQGYPSRRHSIGRLAHDYVGDAFERMADKPVSRIHVVTHSMGGILLRYWLQHHQPENLGRIVMLAPPNQGSELVDYIRRIPLFEKIMGPASVQLGTDQHGVPRQLPPLQAEVGVITGTRNASPWLNRVFGGQHDGKVSVRSARLPEMTDFRVMEVGHTFIMVNRNVTEEIQHFLAHGSFSTADQAWSQQQ